MTRTDVRHVLPDGLPKFPTASWLISIVKAPPKAQPTPSEPSRYGLELLNDPSLKTGDEGTQYQVDIVAIHGLNGHPRNTWTHSDKTLWLRDILPHDLPGAAIFTYGYPSELFFSKSIADVEDFSLRLLNDLSNKISRDVSQA